MKTIILLMVFTVAVIQGHTQVLKDIGKRVLNDVEGRVRQKASEKVAQGIDSMLNKRQQKPENNSKPMNKGRRSRNKAGSQQPAVNDSLNINIPNKLE